MPQEMRLACCCYKETRLNPRVMPPETGLEMATINGAKAALMADRIGSIEVGKEADIVLFDTQRPEWQPLINPVANLVYSATGDSVRDVFVAGEQVVAGGHLTKIDESKLYDEIPVAVSRFGEAPEVRPDGAVALAGVVKSAGEGGRRPSIVGVFGDHQLGIPYEPVADLLARYRARDPGKTAIVDLESGAQHHVRRTRSNHHRHWRLSKEPGHQERQPRAAAVRRESSKSS